MFLKIRGAPIMDDKFLKELRCDLEAFLHIFQDLITGDHTEATDGLLTRIFTYDLPRGFSRRDIALVFIYNFLLALFGPQLDLLIGSSDLKVSINEIEKTLIEIEAKKAREENQEDPPTPFIFYFPYPKGPPVAIADRNLKQSKLSVKNKVSETKNDYPANSSTQEHAYNEQTSDKDEDKNTHH